MADLLTCFVLRNTTVSVSIFFLELVSLLIASEVNLYESYFQGNPHEGSNVNNEH